MRANEQGANEGDPPTRGQELREHELRERKAKHAGAATSRPRAGFFMPDTHNPAILLRLWA